MIEILYSVNVTLKNKVNSTYVTFTEYKKFSTNLASEECSNKTFNLFNGNLYDLFDDKIDMYVINNSLKLNEIEISDFNVSNDNDDDNIEIIVSSNTDNCIDLNVNISAYYTNDKLSTSPTFIAECLTHDSIKLKLPDDKMAHNVYDSQNKHLYSVAIGVCEYIETGLRPGTTYRRKITSFNSVSETDFSNTISVKTKNETPKNNLITEFDETYFFKNNISKINIIDSPLKAFKSGVGHGDDLKIYKSSEVDFINNFDVIGNLYGKYYESIDAFNKVTFEYRIACIGKQLVKESDGFVKLKIKTSTSGHVKLRIYKYASKSVNIKSQIKSKVSYVKRVDGVDVPKVADISSDIFNNNISGNIAYSEASKNAYLVPYDSLVVDSKPLSTILNSKASTHTDINGTDSTKWKFFDVKFYDDYAFDESSNKYSPNKPRVMVDTTLGTLSIHSQGKTSIKLDSGIFLSGYSNGNLFDGEAFITKSFDSINDDIVVLTKQELNNINITNIGDRSYVYDGEESSVVYKIDILEVSEGVVLSSINLSNNNVMTATINTTHETSILQYNFTNDADTVVINTSAVLNGISDSSNIEYNYVMNVINCSENIECSFGDSNTTEYTYPGQILTWIDNCYSKVVLKATSNLIEQVYDSVYPSYTNQPFFGVVNNKTDEFGNYTKNDMVVKLPDVLVPTEVYDVKFKLLLNNIYPIDSHLNYRMYNQNETGYTTTNGDYVRFSSDAVLKKDKLITDLLNVQLCESFSISQDDLDTINTNVVIEISPEILESNKYKEFELELYSTSQDIDISNYKNIVEFDNSSTSFVTYTLKIQKSSSSKWYPLIKNGYYYLNQNEYYLYSESNINSTYEDSIQYSERNISYKIKVELINSTTVSDSETILLKDKSDYINSEHVEYVQGWLCPKAIINGIYYKEYKNFDVIIKEIHFNSIVTSYDYIKWTLSDNRNEITLFVRSFNLNTGAWCDWILVNNNSTFDAPTSFKLQIKVKFEPNVLNEQKDFNEVVSGYDGFYNDYDHESSSNVFLLNGFLQSSNDNDGIFFSKIFDYSVKTRISMSCYFTVANKLKEPIVHIHVAVSDDYYDLQNNPKWVSQDGITNVYGKYVRYRIEFTSNVNIVSVYKNISTIKTTTKPQCIRDVELRVSHETGNISGKTLFINKSNVLTYDCVERTICDNVAEVIEWPVTNNGYNIDDVLNVSIVNDDDDISFELLSNDYDIDNSNIFEVFNGWNKIESGGNYWLLDNNDKSIMHTTPTEHFSAYVSKGGYKDWDIECNLSSNSVGNNPIGVVLAHNVDSNLCDHTLTLLVGINKKRNKQNKVVEYSVYYNYGEKDEVLISNNDYMITSNNDISNWSNLTTPISVKITRKENFIIIYRSQINSNSIDIGSKVEINLLEHPSLMIFDCRCGIGFCTNTQQNAKFSNIHLSINDVVNSKIIAHSTKIQLLNSETEYIEFVDGDADMSPLPQQFSPITVELQDSTALSRVYFNDGKKYTLTNTETFTNVYDSIKLTYTNIDKRTIYIHLNGEVLNNSINTYTVVNNYLFFNNKFNDSDVIKVQYKILNSFCVNYNIENELITVSINPHNSDNKARVKYETNEFDNRVPVKHLSLNPIYNSRNQGFIYLSNDTNEPNNIEIYTTTSYVYANSKDNINICVKLVDKYGNPVPGEILSISCGFGSISKFNEETDINGVVSFKYISTVIQCTDYITIHCARNNLSKKIKIENLEV